MKVPSSPPIVLGRRGFLKGSGGLALLGKRSKVNAPTPLWQPSANVVLDGSGNGIASLGPARAREHWQLSGISVSVATNVLEARCAVYVGSSLSSATFLSATFTGSTGDLIPAGGFDIQPGMQVWAKWTGGDPGSTATVVVNGTYTFGAATFQSAAIIGSFRNQLLPFFEAGNTTIINAQGEFQYNGVPTLGNLIYSNVPLVSGTGTDEFGNIYLAGTTRYSPAAFAVQTNNGHIVFYAWSGSAWVAGSEFDELAWFPAAGISGATALIGNPPNVWGFLKIAAGQTLITPSGGSFDTSALLEVQGEFASEGNIAIVSSAAEVWHAVTVPAGWTGSARVKIMSDINAARFDFNVTSPTPNPSASASFGAFPTSAYYPLTTKFHAIRLSGGNWANDQGVNINTSPTGPTFGNLPTAVSFSASDTIDYPLD